MSLDIAECLEGLRLAHASTPREGSPPQSPHSSVSLRHHDVEVEADPEILKRMLAVEERLLQLLGKDIEEEELKKRVAQLAEEEPDLIIPTHLAHAYPCSDTHNELPSHPRKWPQRPVMVRPTPNTSTQIKGIRHLSSTTYEHFSGFCAGCILPINNGNEREGESLVVDFESPHFKGTLLMRIKQAPQIPGAKYSDHGYFDGKKRKFQAIVKGKFKTPLRMSECITGQAFNRPAGKLPAKWIVTSFVKFVSTLAPQLDATIEGDSPRFLVPLVATAHTVIVNGPSSSEDTSKSEKESLEAAVEEPPSMDETSVMLAAKNELGATIPDTKSSSIAARMKARKTVFNSIAAKHEDVPRFSTEKEYTFEFYQHLLDFSDELAIDMGRPIGKVGLSSCTDGQPIKFMSAHKDPETGKLDSLWSFDIWHESLYGHARSALTGKENGVNQ